MNYLLIYNKIINSALNRTISGYKESHHIVPKCLGGTNDKNNLVNLTAREHFLCHKLLCEIYPNEKKLKYAYWMMCNAQNKYQCRDYKISSKEYERIKKEISTIKSLSCPRI